jgi:hypothetical protein
VKTITGAQQIRMRLALFWWTMNQTEGQTPEERLCFTWFGMFLLA